MDAKQKKEPSAPAKPEPRRRRGYAAVVEQVEELAISLENSKAIPTSQLFFLRRQSTPVLNEQKQVVAWDSVGDMYTLADAVKLQQNPFTRQPLTSQERQRIQQRLALQAVEGEGDYDRSYQITAQALMDLLTTTITKDPKALSAAEQLARHRMQPEDLPCFHAQMNRSATEALLRTASRGSWLLRPSSYGVVEYFVVTDADGKSVKTPISVSAALSIKLGEIRHWLVCYLHSLGWTCVPEVSAFFSAETRYHATLADLLLATMGSAYLECWLESE